MQKSSFTPQLKNQLRGTFIFGILSLIVVALLVSYIHKIMNDPYCVKIEPQKRQFLYFYAWLQLILIVLNLIFIIYALNSL